MTESLTFYLSVHLSIHLSIYLFFSYKSCLPESHRQNIQQLSRLTRFRIRKTLKHFLNKLARCPAGAHSLKLKYLMELAAVEPRHGTECFQVRCPGCSSLTTEPASKSLLVSGEVGIQSRTPDTVRTVSPDMPNEELNYSKRPDSLSW